MERTESCSRGFDFNQLQKLEVGHKDLETEDGSTQGLPRATQAVGAGIQADRSTSGCRKPDLKNT